MSPLSWRCGITIARGSKIARRSVQGRSEAIDLEANVLEPLDAYTGGGEVS
jgi:hypothetical protein